MANFLLHTDFGHDPDDAIALAYLIEHGHIPSVIGLVPGHLQQIKSLAGFLKSYDIPLATILFYRAQKKALNLNFSTCNHEIFDRDNCFLDTKDPYFIRTNKALIIGPATSLSNKLKCKELYFQGGYSPNSLTPLEKFKGIYCVRSYNPYNAKIDFNILLKKKAIQHRYYIGKNVCHGFTKEELRKIWEPANPIVYKFWYELKPNKAMHDVLAAMLFINKDLGIWEQAKPVWVGDKMTTTPTTEEIYTLIGLKL